MGFKFPSIEAPKWSHLTDVIDYSPESLEPLYNKFSSKENSGVGFQKTISQNFDDFEGLGPGSIQIIDDKKEGIVTRWYPKPSQEHIDEQNLKIMRASTLVNAPIHLAPLIAPFAARTKPSKVVIKDPVLTKGQKVTGILPGSTGGRTLLQQRSLNKDITKQFKEAENLRIQNLPNVTPVTPQKGSEIINQIWASSKFKPKNIIEPQGQYPKGDNPYLPITDFDPGSIPGMDGESYIFESRYADELNVSDMTYDQLKFELESRAESLGYQVSDVRLNKRSNQFGIDKDIGSLYLGHAEAYAEAIKDSDKTLEPFPTIIWDDDRFRPKVKNLKGRRYIYFDDYLKRRSNRKLGKSRRDQRIWKQTPEGTPPGTFYREKLAQLRALNEEELALGVPRTKLREVDMDHKNALRSVEIYTEGLNKDNEKIVFDLMEQYGLFRGDDARNLILRKKSVHKDLWPKLKKQLKKLNHKTRKDFDTEGDYMLYLTVWKNPKTGSTPLREYIETIQFVEEQAAIKTVEEVERILKKSTPNIIAKSPMRDKLIDILGGLDSYKSFMKRLMQYPADVRKDMIEAEFGYIGSSDQVDPERLNDLLNEQLPDR